MAFSIQELVKSVEVWLTKGILSPEILHSEFLFMSPFWSHANRQAFIDRFLDPQEYIKTSLSKITSFDPAIICYSEDSHYFTVTLTYHTHNGHDVNETVLCELNAGLIIKMISIYDLNETKMALEIE